MHKAYIIAVAVLIQALAALAQSSDTGSYSLEDVLAIAAQRSDQIAIIDAQHEAGRQQVRFYRSEAYPMVSFSAGATAISQSLKQQTGGAGSSLSGGAGGGSGMPKSRQAQPGGGQQQAAVSYPERLGGQAYNWAISLMQPLITFGRVGNALKLAGMQDSVLELTADMRENVLYLSAMSAFSEAYLAQRQFEIAEKSLATARRLMERTKVEVENGAGSKLDYLTAEARYGGARAEFLTAQSDRTLSRRRLSRIIGLDREQNYVLWLDTASAFVRPPQTQKGLSVEYTLKGLESGMRKAQARYERSKLFPSVYLSGGVSTSAFYNQDDEYQLLLAQTGSEANPPNSAIVDPDFVNYSIGLQLSWTLFDGFRTAAARYQAEAQGRVAALEQKQIGEKDEIAIQEGFERLDVIEESVVAVSAQLDASQRAFDLADDDFTRGYVDMTVYLDTEKKLREAEARLSSLRMQKILVIAQLKFTMGLPVYEGSR
jgi:HAE1 family hydrophobic/amphiphilic exporter-1